MLSTSLDLDQNGFQKGYIDVPVSLNHSAWSNQRVPIFCLKNGDGPTLLLLGGCHGDEYEAPIALSKLLHGGLDLENLTGRVIVLPAMNPAAVQCGTRLSPLDGGNMNRAFPGNPRGSATERIADFISRELISRADVVLDLHSGGRSLMFKPCTIVPMQATPAATQEIMELANAFAAPMMVVLREPQVETMIDTEVEKQGKRILATELGGSGIVTAETVTITRKGILGVMRVMGLLAPASPVDGEKPPASTPSETVYVDGLHHYIYADDHGIFEPSAGVGMPVSKGEPIGFLHFADRVDIAPKPIFAGTGGVLFCSAGQGLVRRGDVLAVIGHTAPPPELV
ncbi:succinylglutamate desuccinylase/aspartoacylase family protein [Roseibium sp.]|uniref:succinylglutamate desuccinylase/aspartoacylase family protein n=1 Tax=Roseibium sp. TaxID=1936156 RepID=UPI003B524CC0